MNNVRGSLIAEWWYVIMWVCVCEYLFYTPVTVSHTIVIDQNKIFYIVITCSNTCYSPHIFYTYDDNSREWSAYRIILLILNMWKIVIYWLPIGVNSHTLVLSNHFYCKLKLNFIMFSTFLFCLNMDKFKYIQIVLFGFLILKGKWE